MCGISGFITKDNNILSDNVIREMNRRIAHRGPDAEGYYHGPNFSLGHRRLAIIDLSENGHQPMAYMDKYVITYNGEIYNYQTLKEELLRAGYQFNNLTDTEVIMAAYDKWGEECVYRFNGMWAFVIYDKEKEILFCSRDRFGIKPFYYTKIDNYFAFGSEIKQFTVIDGWQAKGNMDRIIDFLLLGLFDHTEETMFEGVFQLRGGHNLTYNLKSHTFEIKKYYDIEDSCESINDNSRCTNRNNKDFNIQESKLKSGFYELFRDSVALRLRADVKVGSCLSGGLDSSSIVCMASKILKESGHEEKQMTVSSCSAYKQYDEQEYIDEVQVLTQVQNYKVFPSFQQLIDSLDQITWHQDEPFGSLSIFAQWCVFAKAREADIPVMLDGQGADEQLAGYDGLTEIYLKEFLSQGRLGKYLQEIRAVLKVKKCSHKQVSVIILKSLLPSFLKTKTKEIFTRKKRSINWLKNGKTPEPKVFAPTSTLRDTAVQQLKYTSLPMLLHYEDRNSMAHSIEARVPFLDYRLVELVLSLPAKAKLGGGWSKKVLRDAMSGILPEKIKNRIDKMSFVTPEEIWIRENKEWFRVEMVELCKRFKLVDEDKLLLWFDNLLGSGKPLGHDIWRLVSLNRWIKVFNVKL